ncbi:MAG: hypothetical protein A2X82_01250 [Geobacteraceae bacterium GWC2_55_20]|nr:MAG: hypothetical protein A2X82_01250 [Geobacteraceae bacterium GWC2_55_20]OGU25713.1 MAG: hypothetical protein A2X85_14205 [Geobacteraceae bacterium GWF2_54_21]HCE68585.1 hypothetical protein [Geobacter sp.]
MNTCHLTKSQFVVFACVTLVCAFWLDLFTAIPQRWDAVPTFDTVFFIKLAENILKFKEFGWIGYHEPCFYPLLTAFLTIFTGDLYVSAVTISKVSTVLLPGVVYLFARDLFSDRVGLSAALLMLFFPHMKTISGSSQSEALYVFLITCSATLLWKSWKGASAPVAVCAGISFAAAYLTRSEGIFTMLFLIAFLVIFGRSVGHPRAAVQTTGIILITFAIICTPYIGHLSKHYGSLTIGTKTSGIYFWVRDKCFHDPDPERTEWGLSPQGELNLISMKSQDLLAYWRRDIPRSINVYLKNFSEQIPGRIPNDGGIKHYPQIYPVYLAIPLVAGLILLYRRCASFIPAGYLLSGFLLLFIYPLLTGGWWRYLINLLPFFLILSAMSLDEIATSIFHDKRSRLLLAVAVALTTVYHIWIVAWQPVPQNVVSYQSNKSSVAEETRKAGAWARRILPADASYMAQWTRLPFYLQGRWIAMPEADLDGVLYYARKNAAAYLLIESDDALTVAQLTKLGIPGVTYVGTYASQTISYYCTLLQLK